MTNNSQAAVYFVMEGYDTSAAKLMGRNAAGEGFLKGLCQYGKSQEIYCYGQNRRSFEQFAAKVKPWVGGSKTASLIPFDRVDMLEKPGTLFYPSPGVGGMAWLRRRVGAAKYSICGVTHTISSDTVMDTFGELLTAPVQPWDALICTSNAGKAAAEYVLNSYGEYLATKFGCKKPEVKLQMPVIPLGIHAADFSPQNKSAIRANWRQKLGIADNEIAVLFVGRLSFHAKAHPLPMYLALEKVAAQTGRRIHLVQAGWFANEHIEQSFKQAAKALCPSVNCLFVDGRTTEAREGIWFAGDIFCSLADSIQETFGLAPVEAMAAGLPVVVTDWDGYKDTVIHGEQGFKVRTLQAPPGSGNGIMRRYESATDTYDLFSANTGLCVAVDVEQTAKAFLALVENPDLRRRMGEAGIQRTKEVYDWRHVIAAYENLWSELAEIRAKAGQTDGEAHPLRPDPFSMFSGFPSANINAGMKFKIAVDAPEQKIAQYRNLALCNYASVFDPKIAATIIEQCRAGQLQINESSHLTLAWLLKMGILAEE